MTETAAQLQHAALAGGLLVESCDPRGFALVRPEGVRTEVVVQWNPWAWDRDAFALATALGMTLEISAVRARACCCGFVEVIAEKDGRDRDTLSHARRAIALAAVAVGKRMSEQTENA